MSPSAGFESHSRVEEYLINKVREHAFLYIPSSPGYRSPQLRRAAWERIGEELQMTGVAAKERWDRLRRCFCNARRRRNVNNGVQMSKGEQRSIWKYYRQMSFIIPFLEKRRSHKTQSTYPKEETATEDYSDAREENEAKGNFHLTAEAEGVEAAQPLDAPPRAFAARRPIESDENSPQKIMEPIDATDMFFLSMSRMTKSLPRVEATRIKFALSNSVLMAEERCAQQTV